MCICPRRWQAYFKRFEADAVPAAGSLCHCRQAGVALHTRAAGLAQRGCCPVLTWGHEHLAIQSEGLLQSPPVASSNLLLEGAESALFDIQRRIQRWSNQKCAHQQHACRTGNSTRQVGRHARPQSSPGTTRCSDLLAMGKAGPVPASGGRYAASLGV